jgi:hypothetical protein
MNQQYNFTISPTDQSAEIIPEQVLELLNQWGIVHIPSYLNSTQVSLLQNEFHVLLEHQEKWIRPIDYSLGAGVKFAHNEIDQARFPMTFNLFSSTFMQTITDRYLGQPNWFNHEIFVVKDVVGSTHLAQDLHHDILPTLKFFLYLTDTTAQNGAFHCVPGSQTYTQSFQQQNREQGIRPERSQTRDLPLELAQKSIPIEGTAGTLIFHTDVFHRAGNVLQGERWVMRAHSRRSSDMGALHPPEPKHRKMEKVASVSLS